MNEKVISIKLDRRLRRVVDAPAVGSLDLKKTFGEHRGIHPSDVLELFVFSVLRKALAPYITMAAVCRYDPFRGVLFVRYGNMAGGDWIDGGNRPAQRGQA
jgi:hypothetical protein